VNKIDTFNPDTPDTAHPCSLSQQIDRGFLLQTYLSAAAATKHQSASPARHRQIWDTAGQECFCAVTSAYYHGVFDVLFVYDISRRFTFDTAERWL
jgi:hypothetical protein